MSIWIRKSPSALQIFLGSKEFWGTPWIYHPPRMPVTTRIVTFSASFVTATGWGVDSMHTHRSFQVKYYRVFFIESKLKKPPRPHSGIGSVFILPPKWTNNSELGNSYQFANMICVKENWRFLSFCFIYFTQKSPWDLFSPENFTGKKCLKSQKHRLHFIELTCLFAGFLGAWGWQFAQLFSSNKC